MTNAKFQQAVLEKLSSLDDKVDFLAVRLFNVEDGLAQCATKSELNAFRQETLSRFDGLAKNQERFDHELVAIIGRQDRLEGVRS